MAQDKDQKTLNVPPLRFTGFTDEWKECTIRDIAKIEKGNGISKDQLSEEGDECILYGELYTKYKSEIIDEVYSKTKVDSTKLMRSQANDVLIPCSGETAEDIATARCVKMEGILLGGDLNIMRFDKQDGAFMSYQLNGKRKYDIARVAQGVSVVHLYPEHLKSIKVVLPELEEQQKIVNLLSLIDERIATQNKIIEDLKKLKSAIIDKLLGRVQTAQSDRMVKLGEIGKFTRGLTYSAEDIVEDGGIVVVRANNLSNGEAVNFYNEIVRVDKPISDSQLLKYGDMVICMANGSSALVGKASYYNETTDSIATIGAFCGIYRSDKKIVRWLLQTNKYKRVIHKSLQGGNGAIANLTPNDILGLSFIIPKQEPSIVELLQGFDEKLDIEISLLHSLQKEKQYLLSQMFI